MSTDSQRKKLFDGLSPKAAKPALAEILAKGQSAIDLKAVDRDFKQVHAVSLLSVCETWHRLRSANQTVKILIQVFAEKVSRLNKEKAALGLRIREQRERLALLEKLVAERKLVHAHANGEQVPAAPSPEERNT